MTLTSHISITNVSLTKRVCQKSQVVRPEGAEAPSPGQRPGCNASKSKAPCKGKSVYYQRFCPYRAYYL